jgi:hypothetical protein
VTIDEVQAVEVDVPELEARADVMVEQRKLDAELAQSVSDLGVQLLAASYFLSTFRCFGIRVIWFP